MSYKWWIIIAIALFAIGLALGLTTPPGTNGLLSENIAALEELAALLASLPQFAVFLIIFIKNAFTLLFCFTLSPFFCLVPILALIVNGWLLAEVSVVVIQENSLSFLLAGLLPHGILELPAFFLGQAAALSFGTTVILAVFRKESRSLLLPNLKQNLKYLSVAVALLLPAAIIETYITPLLLT